MAVDKSLVCAVAALAISVGSAVYQAATLWQPAPPKFDVDAQLAKQAARANTDGYDERGYYRYNEHGLRMRCLHGGTACFQ